MRVTVCQIDSREEALESCLASLSEHIKAESSDLLLLPEMGFSDWLAADPTPSATRWAQAVTSHERQIAAMERLGAKSVLGTRPIVTAQGSRRNEAYLWSVDTQQAIPLHQKYYLPDEEGYFEHRWYERGPKTFEVGRTLDARIGVQICTEMWFFEWARHYAASRVDLLCVPRATPHGSTDKWLAGGRAAAVTSGAYCLSSNLWCPVGSKANCGGLSWIIDPEGEILARTDHERPYATIDVDLEVARASKSSYPRYVPE